MLLLHGVSNRSVRPSEFDTDSKAPRPPVRTRTHGRNLRSRHFMCASKEFRRVRVNIRKFRLIRFLDLFLLLLLLASLGGGGSLIRFVA